MNHEENYKIETIAIHGGYDSSDHKGSLITPIYQSSTFTFDSAEQGERRFKGVEDGYVYSRLGNPTVHILEERIAKLEGGEAGLAFGSGMAAVSSVLFTLLKAGDHILVSNGIYGCTFGLLQLMQDRFNISHSFSELDSPATILNNLQPHTKVIYLETPINPTMTLLDLEMIIQMAKEKGITVVVDNTFCSPYLQQPIKMGSDVVIHSATKYIGGHGDAVAGLAVGKKELMNEIALSARKDIGGIMSPFDAWLLLRGLKTLPVRMDRHCQNAKIIAEKLKRNEFVDAVYFPGDKDSKHHSIYKKQMKNSGGILTFTIKGSKKDAQKLLNSLKLIKLAVSLGDTETLIQHPATMTHAVVPEKVRKVMGITDNMLRLSVGLEAWEDIWTDLKCALDTLGK